MVQCTGNVRVSLKTGQYIYLEQGGYEFRVVGAETAEVANIYNVEKLIEESGREN